MYRFTKCSFVFSMCGLIDIYELLAKISCNCQRSNTFIWQVLYRNEQLLKTLVDMESSFRDVSDSGVNESKLHFHNAWRELAVVREELVVPNEDEPYNPISRFVQYRQCKLRMLKLPPKSQPEDESITFHVQPADTIRRDVLKLMTRISGKLAGYARSLHEHLEKQFTQNIPEVVKLTYAIFNISQIDERDPDTVVVRLEKLFNMSKDFGLYDNEDLQFESFKYEYALFAADAKLKLTTLRSKPRHVKKEEDLDIVYLELLNASATCLYPNVLRLLSASAARQGCESVIEGTFSSNNLIDFEYEAKHISRR